MIDLKKLQKRILENKLQKGFNTKDISIEFNLIYEEVPEAYRAYSRKLPDLGEELADVVIYVLGLSEILGIDLEDEIIKKITKNERRKYKKVDGIFIKIEG
jgi:NTP pyrophosphatase (non-canonical NTP hydrolase)